MTTLMDVREANYKYDCGLGMQTCQKAAQPEVLALFGGDPLKALLYIAADGYALNVGSNITDPVAKRNARLRWNRDRAESEAERLRERHDD